MGLHWIQNEILQKLYETDQLTFSELRPENLENDQYNYHLKKLISAGCVQKTDNTYRITDAGKVETSKADEAGKPLKQPKLSLLVKIQNKSGKYYLSKRTTHPFIGVYMFPTTRVRVGELFEESLQNKVDSLPAVKTRFVYEGVFRRVFRPSDQFIDDRMLLVYSCSVDVESDDFYDLSDLEGDWFSNNIKPLVNELPDKKYMQLFDEPGEDPRY